jgi:PPOX class probable F420-dependent enzyme
MAMTFDDPRIQRYLATKDIVVLGTINPDGSPLVTAMWFLHDEDALTLISVDDLQKVKNLRRDPRLHIVAESGSRGAEIRGVAVRGRARFLVDSPERRALVTRIVDKYHPHLEGYWGGRAMPANRVMFRVTPERVTTWGLD